MMELADLATVAFIATGLTYQSVKYWRSERKIRLKREIPVSLVMCNTAFPEDFRHAVIFVLDRRGYLTRKFPDTDIVKHKGKFKLQCSSHEGVLNFCVLFSPHVLCLSGIHTRADIDRLFSGEHNLFMAETGLQEIRRSSFLELVPIQEEVTEVKDSKNEKVSIPLSMLLPHLLTTDAMAKEYTIDLKRSLELWNTGSVRYPESESENWLAMRREGEKLVLQLRTNFGEAEREAYAILHGEGGTHTIKVCQQMMGLHPTLTVSHQLYVTSGQKNEIVAITITPDNEETEWRIKSANTSDDGCWYTVHPPVGVYQKGTKTLKVHFKAKPATVRSRVLTLTLETGTYPFNQTTDINLMQGVYFKYYIEYPRGDVCARHSDAIETPLDYTEESELKTYTICVDSNQPWRIICNGQVDWIDVSEPEMLPGIYGGRFTVRVHSNASYLVKNGFPAARHAILSLVNDTGIVKDILIYQGGYVRIRGHYWLDRNLATDKRLTPIAIPLGLKEESMLNYGSYFQFGSLTDEWLASFVFDKGNWYEGKAENPSRLDTYDPSPEGWRIPSHIEIEDFLNRPIAPLELQREESRTNVCLLSDDGVPVYLPLCGHRSHINGCQIIIPQGHRYWTGSSQSPVYGYSLCIEPSRQMYVMHNMKKYGFPIRCILNQK